MRGKEITPFSHTSLPGITPAYAGKRSTSRGHVEAVRDHPRLCGEKGESVEDAFSAAGSPPPMRGKGTEPVGIRADVGITPAYAGKRRRFCSLTVAI